MRRLRSTWVACVLVAVVAASLGLAAVVPAAQVAQRAATLSYAEWLRAQLADSEAPQALEQALQAAVEADPRSLQEFLTAFIETFEQENPGVRLIDVLSPRALTSEVLLSQLLGRFGHLVGNALLPRLLFASAQASVAGTLSRLAAVFSGSAAGHVLRPPAAPFVAEAGAALLPVLSIRLRWAALPLGP